METIIIHCTYKGQRYRIKTLVDVWQWDLEDALRKKFHISDEYYLIRIDEKVHRSPTNPSVCEGDEYIFEKRSNRDNGCDTPIIPLYGCPSAKDTPGNLPDCMFNTFDGFIINEV